MSGENPKCDFITSHTFGYDIHHPNISFIPDTRFQKCLCLCEIYSLPPQMERTQNSFQLLYQDNVRASVSGTGLSTYSYLRSRLPHTFSIYQWKNRIIAIKPPICEIRELKLIVLSGHSSMEKFLGQLSRGRGEGSLSMSPHCNIGDGQWYNYFVQAEYFSSQLSDTVNLGSRNRSNG